MKSAPVTELKASLSRFLAAVKSGEELLITERGKPIAKIVPLPPAAQPEEDRLRRMEARGLVRLGDGRLPRMLWNAPRPADPGGEIRKALLSEREASR
jgi:prevent-host-death family protein